jgi:hypothetical protein
MKRGKILKISLFLVILGILVLSGRTLFQREGNRVRGTAINSNIPRIESSVRHAEPVPVEITQTAGEGTERSHRLFRTAEVLWNQPGAEEAFARFHDWAENYIRVADAQKPTLEAEGIGLAQNRRDALIQLIQSDPERALALAVPMAVRESLPSTIVALLEERVAGRGRLAVLGALVEPGHEKELPATFRTANLGGTEYKAFVYGRRLGQPTRDNVPMQGIALNKLLAIREDPVRILEEVEATKATQKVIDPVCSVSGLPASINHEQIAAEIASELVFVCRASHAVQLNENLTAAEEGPVGPVQGQDAEASTWTEGQKKVILIRVDFPDLVGTPLSDSAAITLLNNLDLFYKEMSYGRAGFFTNGAGSEFTPTFRMPQPASWYGTNDNYNQLRTDARNAATALGYVLSSYDRDVICMGSVQGFNWAGLAYIGAGGAWLRNSFSTGVAGHELGHNWGLNHANFWDTSGQSVIGPGTSTEYGDSFDTMGSASAGNNHFNARYKNYLNWLTSNDVVTATSNGTYRIYAHDNPNSYGARGLRIIMNTSTNYWVEFRQKFTGNKWLMNGAGLRWAQNGNQRSQLLDTTPGSSDAKNDSAIVIGRTFSDKVSGIHITPIGKGSTSPESLDVVVNLGSFPSNLAPLVDVSPGATTAAVGATLDFLANASDPDGDVLAYYWNFGDGNFGTNGPAASKSWTSAGEYVVRCVVSDMKGGEASKSIIVTIGSPTTFRLSGRVLDTNGPVQAVRVYVSTSRMAYTDSDGTYTIVGIPAGTYTVNASLQDYVFASSGFTNPVSVAQNVANIDFAANLTSYTAPNITTQPLSQTVNPGTNVTFTVAATGTTPIYYQWRFNGGNIAGANGATYTRNNVQAANAGNYSVVVSNIVGTAVSANAILTINTPPSISAQPQNQNIIAGTTATFSVSAMGSAPLSYQWRLNGTNLPGAISSSYTKSNAQAADAGTYSVVVANSLGSVTSAPAALTLNFALVANASYGGTVTKSPDASSYPANAIVTLTASSISVFPFSGWSGDASGTNNPLTVIVNSNKTIYANFVSPVSDLIIDNPSAYFTGSWTTDSAPADKYGSDYEYASTSANGVSATATFVPNITVSGRYDVYVWFPTITKGAPNANFVLSDVDGAVTNTVNMSGGSGGWQLLATGAAFAQGTNGYLRLNNTGAGGKSVAADAVRLVYSEDQAGSPPIITTAPQDQTVPAGQSATFNVGVTGTAPVAYQWCLNGAALWGSTNSSLLITNSQSTNVGLYNVIVTNVSGTATSTVAALTVLFPPSIVAQFQSQRVLEGSSLEFTLTAEGTQPLAFQWLFNSIVMPGKTGPSLLLSDVQPANAGEYSVTLSNMAGMVTSAPASLVVSTRPMFGSNFLIANGHPVFTLTGTPGDRYVIEFSTNLVTWTDGPWLTNTTGFVEFTDIDSTNYRQRFCRCRLLP